LSGTIVVTHFAPFTVRLAGRVYVPPRLSKEVENRDRNAQSGDGTGEAAAETRCGIECRSGEVNMTKRDYVEGTGNAFADLGLPQPDEAFAKAELAQKIVAILRTRRLTQMDAAAILGVDQPKVSALMRFLLRLGRDVEINVKPRPLSRSQSRLLVA
jgi:predicted XRE-type DNA-binding protein